MIQAAKKPIESRPGPIEAGCLYPLADFQARSGLSKWAMRSARRAGLKVRRVGNRAYVSGADFIAFVESAG